MTTETQVAPVAETQNTATEPTEQPGVVEPGSTDAEGQQASATEEAKTEKSAEQKEIERLRRQLTKRDRTQGKLHQELEALREQVPRQQDQGEAQPVDPMKLAEEIVSIKEINNKANAIAKDGNTRFPDFNTSVQALQAEAGPMFNERGRPTPLGEAILDSEDAAALIQYLGANSDVASELEGLSPTALGRKVARIEAQMAAAPAPKPVSKASEPINPIRGTANASVKSPDQMSQSEYEAHRKSQGARWAR